MAQEPDLKSVGNARSLRVRIPSPVFCKISLIGKALTTKSQKLVVQSCHFAHGIEWGCSPNLPLGCQNKEVKTDSAKLRQKGTCASDS